MKVACITDMGRSRDINEDSCIHCKFDNNWDLLIVADGMGGHNAGEVASKIAVKSITQYIKSNMIGCTTERQIIQLIKNAVLSANKDIYDESINNAGYSGMGTTVTLAIIINNNVYIGHVGDSRAYIIRNGKIKKLTNDHSLVAELVKNGTITEQEALHHPQRNIITRALGSSDNVNVDIETTEIEEDNAIILCTDGLTNMVTDKELEEAVVNGTDIVSAARTLVDKANEQGGFDNITVIIAKTPCPDREVRQ